ncbi:class I SAM-dependent methyltransferase [Albimonas sp. CAU 1670]|uniref:class I SAM-dependent methyltransferase n=1 Tax=Albimonas sp. CAU 1670 TaxID=3032599 RepID=UPI0023DB9604|nr:class I SAM-dependent methyltransferase [Albimonas sp. CAU 1670]MDF2232476.1 class I SAM-dependent methyltransferase [Albimonas sp. CAU 1670]
MTVDAADPLAANLARWNARAEIHMADRTGFYDVEGVVAGTRTFEGVSDADLGPVEGLRIAHVQCHFGLDSLILARKGAVVEGLDFSPVAIEGARALAAQTGLPATFHLGDAMRAAEVMGAGRFDMVFVTWGTICWLPDVFAWGAQVAALLKPGGRLFFRDGHPAAQALDPVDGRLVPCFDWRTAREAPLRFEEETTYTGDADALPPVADHEWIHPVSDIVMALLRAGLRLDGIEEHDFLVWDMWPGVTERGEDGLWRLPPGQVRVPLSLTVRASRPA